MARKAHRVQSRRFSDVWVYVATCLLTAFTVFVLLDTFALARVQQVAQAADYSSIVAAEEASSADSASEVDESGNEAEESGPEVMPADDSSKGVSVKNGASDTSSSSSSSRSHGKRGHGAHGSSSGSGESRNSVNAGASSNASQIEEGAGSAAAKGTSIGSYSDENMQISVSKVRAYDTDIYVADIQVSSAGYLKTALAQGAFGRNLKDTTSNMAEEASAVLAINGDYYGFRDEGYVLRNGVLYRDIAASGTDALVVYGDGTMAAAPQDEMTAAQLEESGAWQVLSFGPVLVSDGSLAVTEGDEVDQSMGSNPRTAIGMVSPLHYVVVVSDGRTDENAGLSLYQLAQVFVDNGATFAYNLDGGGSTTLYFQGQVVNDPTSGNRSGERSVSDIVYFG